MIFYLAVYTLAFALKEKDGPFNILSVLRNKLFLNKYLGVFFIKLFECYFCLGFYLSATLYLLQFESLTKMVIASLAGATTTMILSLILDSYYRFTTEESFSDPEQLKAQIDSEGQTRH